LAPPSGSERAGEIYAQLGETTQFWDQPAIYRSGYERESEFKDPSDTF
jgi:hypothetical protein